MQRWIEEPHTDGPGAHGREDRRVVAGLEVDEAGEGLAAIVLVLAHDQAAQRYEPLLGEEHMFRAREANALRAETERRRNRLQRFRVSAHLDLAGGVRPVEEARDRATDVRLAERQRAHIDAAVGAVDGDAVAGAELLLADAAGVFHDVKAEIADARDAGTANDTGDDGRVARHAAARGEDAGRRFH